MGHNDAYNTDRATPSATTGMSDSRFVNMSKQWDAVAITIDPITHSKLKPVVSTTNEEWKSRINQFSKTKHKYRMGRISNLFCRIWARWWRWRKRRRSVVGWQMCPCSRTSWWRTTCRAIWREMWPSRRWCRRRPWAKTRAETWRHTPNYEWLLSAGGCFRLPRCQPRVGRLSRRR